MLESLETRRLLSATLLDGVLTVTGTDGNDDIEVHYERIGSASTDPFKLHVRLNGGLIGEFEHNEVSRINVFALTGDDRISLSGLLPGAPVPVEGPERGGINVAAYIEGGGGNDRIIGGNENDTIIGGAGDDDISGGRGDDLISGGAGRDKLHGNDGDDTLIGGAGNDGLSGGGGSDRITGGSGIDTVDYSDRTQDVAIVIGTIRLPDVWPKNGNPVIPAPDFDIRHYHGSGWLEGDYIEIDVENAIGGKGNDAIWGSDSDNVLVGGDGDDLIYGGLGLDTLYGGNGNDRLFAADNRDGSPVVGPGPRPGDRVHGGGGRDYAMVDLWDTLIKINDSELMPYLWS